MVLCWCGVNIGFVLVWSEHWLCVGVECTLVVCWCGVNIGCVLVWSVQILCDISVLSLPS